MQDALLGWGIHHCGMATPCKLREFQKFQMFQEFQVLPQFAELSL